MKYNLCISVVKNLLKSNYKIAVWMTKIFEYVYLQILFITKTATDILKKNKYEYVPVCVKLYYCNLMKLNYDFENFHFWFEL